ncbi:hypothetical protein AB0C38_22605 [Amycolatopsis sp. NPDC048633]|uniref:DUF6234 family protein n=1 Tax=Amycolatopsis sp. NPDC048633 TaxID=3157095 RepID=UPI00340E1775
MGEHRTVWSSLVLALCTVGLLLVVPFLFLQGFAASFSLFGTSSHAGDGYLTWSAWLGAGMSLVGVVVAAFGRRRGYAWFFGICVVLALVVAVMVRVHHVRDAPPPPPEPRHCVERSGGGNDCPGG